MAATSVVSRVVSSTKLGSLKNLLALLPTGTYLTFSTIIPITANNGDCNVTEKIVTGVVVFFFVFVCASLSFTDSCSAADGSVWYGVVTTTGLWNPRFAYSGLPNVTGWTYTGGGTDYTLRLTDFYIAFLSVVSFLGLSLLSSEHAECYFPGINETMLKVIPLGVNFVVGIALSICASGETWPRE